MLTSHRVTQRATRDGVDAVVVERDYVLAHLVAQLPHVRLPGGQHLLFKGGTALRLVYFDDYRYSADLDFTILGGPQQVAVDALGQVVTAAREHGQFPVLELVTNGKLLVRYVGPCRASKPRDVKVDISTDEYVKGFVPGRVSSAWPDLPPQQTFDVYTLEEIAAEKLRCVMQRLQCRDLFDLHHLAETAGVRITDVVGLFGRKAATKNLDPDDFETQFERRLLSTNFAGTESCGPFCRMSRRSSTAWCAWCAGIYDEPISSASRGAGILAGARLSMTTQRAPRPACLRFMLNRCRTVREPVRSLGNFLGNDAGQLVPAGAFSKARPAKKGQVKPYGAVGSYRLRSIPIRPLSHPSICVLTSYFTCRSAAVGSIGG